MIPLRPPEVGYIDRPDHPSLRDMGCSERARRAFIYGLVGGMAFGAVWGLAVSYKCKHRGMELVRSVGRSTWLHGGAFGGGLCAAFALPCY